MSGHTPGPWHYQPAPFGHPDNKLNPIIQSSDQNIARTFWVDCPMTGMSSRGPSTLLEAEANARLIAAAPETLRQRGQLLEAAKEAKTMLKTRGHTNCLEEIHPNCSDGLIYQMLVTAIAAATEPQPTEAENA